LGLVKNARVTTEDGIVSVTIGGQMADWQRWELIKEFRENFESSNVVIRGVGVHLSGEATMRTSF